MKIYLCSLLLLLGITTNAQFSVRLIVTDVATRKNDDIYVSGNFNNWNPRDEKYKLKPFGGSRKAIVMKDMPAGTYAFKFSRGDAAKLESTADGRDVADRVLEVTEDASKEFVIPGWKDDYPEKPKRYTASPQVKVIDTAFRIPQLNRTRRIWVYLPKGYTGISKIYPVLYMQDGQELFNDQAATASEWGVDECLDTLQSRLGKECIVVAIDNGGDKRSSEYDPYKEGKQYADFLATTLKPYIDSKYRTKKGAEATFITGSGLGGVISLYTLFQYPFVFGTAVTLSAPFSTTPAIYADAEKFQTPGSPRIYLYTGGREATPTSADLLKMAEILGKKPLIEIRKVTSPLGQLNEKTWGQEFADMYRWLLR